VLNDVLSEAAELPGQPLRGSEAVRKVCVGAVPTIPASPEATREKGRRRGKGKGKAEQGGRLEVRFSEGENGHNLTTQHHSGEYFF